MRMLNRTVALSLSFLLASILAPGVAEAQAPQYPPQQPYPQQGYPQQQAPGYPPQQAYPQPGYPEQQAPGYPPQQAYPQQGYPQQQAPGYPQQQAPGYPQQQAPGYPPAPGYQQEGAPQPGYYAPPPAYPPPPANEPPPISDQPPARPATRRGLLFLPYMGFHSVVGSYSDGYSTGFHMGGFLGGHIGPIFSLNGEISFDYMNLNTGGYNDANFTEVFFDFTLSPLFHFGAGPYVEFVVGPKLGIFVDLGSESYQGSSSTNDYNASGLVYGFTTGAFFPLGRIALGALFSFTGRTFLEMCSTSSGSSEQCNSSPSVDDFKLISFSFAMLL